MPDIPQKPTKPNHRELSAAGRGLDATEKCLAQMQGVDPSSVQYTGRDNVGDYVFSGAKSGSHARAILTSDSDYTEASIIVRAPKQHSSGEFENDTLHVTPSLPSDITYDFRSVDNQVQLVEPPGRSVAQKKAPEEVKDQAQQFFSCQAPKIS